jgi:hypothetical protein
MSNSDLPSAESIRLAKEFVDETDSRVQVKIKLAMMGMPLLADMIDEAVVMAREIIRLHARHSAGRRKGRK